MKQLVIVKVETDDVQHLDRIAKNEGRTRSGLIRKILSDYLKKVRRRKK